MTAFVLRARADTCGLNIPLRRQQNSPLRDTRFVGSPNPVYMPSPDPGELQVGPLFRIDLLLALD